MQDFNTVQITGTRAFDAHQLRRIPVTVSEDAQRMIDASTHQGRLLPLALSEAFGGHPDIAEICVDISKKRDIFPLAASEDENTQLLRITIKHTDAAQEDGLKLINAADLHEMHPSGLWGFDAAQTALELLRVHRLEKSI